MSQNIKTIKDLLIWILVVSSVFELLFFPTIANLTGILVTWMSILVYYNLIFQPRFLYKYPLLFVATLILFGFMYLPMPLTLIDGMSMSHDLLNPELTYILQFIYFLLTILSVKLAAWVSDRYNGIYFFLKKIGYFKVPTISQIYILALFGWIFKYQTLKNQFSGDDIYVSGMGTFAMFSIFIYSPITILFRELLGAQPCSKVQKIVALIYMLLLTIILVATNSRGAMLSAWIILSLCFCIKYISEKKRYNFITPKNLLIILFTTYIITGPFNDMAYAMLMARGNRQGVQFTNLFEETINYYNDKNALNKFRLYLDKVNNDVSLKDWNEEYVSNIFLQRFCNYRVVDASIYHALRAGTPSESMVEDFGARIMAMFPQPIINVLNPDFRKEQYSYSPMDLLYAKSQKSSIHVSYIVGGDVGLGLATFGFLYFPIVFIVYTIQLLIINSLMRVNGRKNIFPFLTLISLFNILLPFQVGSGLVVHVIYIIWSFWWTLIWKLIPFRVVLMFNKLKFQK